MVYSQDVVKIATGNSIKWLPTQPGHNVEFIAGSENLELPTKSYINREFSMKFEMPGIYLYVCSPHSIMGLIGIVVVGNDVSNKKIISEYTIEVKLTKS